VRRHEQSPMRCKGSRRRVSRFSRQFAPRTLGCDQNHAVLKVSSGTTLAQREKAIALGGVNESGFPLFKVRHDGFDLVGLANERANDPAFLGELLGCPGGKQAIQQFF